MPTETLVERLQNFGAGLGLLTTGQSAEWRYLLTAIATALAAQAWQPPTREALYSDAAYAVAKALIWRMEVSDERNNLEREIVSVILPILDRALPPAPTGEQ